MQQLAKNAPQQPKPQAGAGEAQPRPGTRDQQEEEQQENRDRDIEARRENQGDESSQYGVIRDCAFQIDLVSRHGRLAAE